jgi:hypothetical protein
MAEAVDVGALFNDLGRAVAAAVVDDEDFVVIRLDLVEDGADVLLLVVHGHGYQQSHANSLRAACRAAMQEAARARSYRTADARGQP